MLSPRTDLSSNNKPPRRDPSISRRENYARTTRMRSSHSTNMTPHEPSTRIKKNLSRLSGEHGRLSGIQSVQPWRTGGNVWFRTDADLLRPYVG
jgi:hypothetical protein